ncbi:MAG: ATP-binding protein [Bradyrhizobium sp.]|uniref:ATP-binding protein n=1 Tax=Bradyrhizobium sp. TaxID=376 RepID=UPI003C7A66F9
MGELMRRHDWQATPLGDPAAWPQSLRSAVSIMLNSRYPIALYWGSELALLYNDAWSPIPGSKHPWALGRAGREVWPEIWDAIGPLFDEVRTTGEGVWQEDELLPMLRHGYLEECYFNFTFSPVRGEEGNIDGIFNAVVETTDRVLSERRLRTLSRLGERANASLSVDETCLRATGILAENRADVPFALLYLREGDTTRLVATVGCGAVPPAGGITPWPLDEAERQGGPIAAPAMPGYAPSDPFWSEPVTEVVIAPITVAGEQRSSAFLVMGANPRRRVDANYLSFFDLAAGHIGTAIATARAYEDERRRAQMLAEIDRAKTAFFSNVSHEFRTPLTLMLGPLEDALAATAVPEQRARLEVAHRNALRLLRLVNALLDFSRLEAGRVDATFRPADLPTVTSDLASSFRSATDRAGLRLNVDVRPLSGEVYVDHDMWEKIVLNLMSNAFKFTHQGEIAVSLQEQEGQAVLTVRDTGVGIPAEELPKLFDRFHRVEGAQGRSFEGSGIGLALVEELVKLHGGLITVASELGRGTTFTVKMPLGLAHLPPDRVQPVAVAGHDANRAQAFVGEALRWISNSADPDLLTEVVPAHASAQVPPEPKENGSGRSRVLLADDNADLRDYIARLLQESGYDVQAAADGKVALAAIKTEPPDLLLTDVMMPELDGFGLLRAVREQSELRDIPVIMLSARAGEEATIEGIEAGADDYLTKPFSSRELLARVSANIKMARVRREAAEAIRASEQRLKDLNATLERRVAEVLAERRILADIVEGTDAFVQVVDPAFRWVAINKAASAEFESIFGVRPAVGDSMLDLLTHLPDEREAVRKVWARALAGEEFTEVGAFGDPGRNRRHYEMKYNSLRDDQGRRIGAYQFVYDVTARVREQERLAQAEEQLRHAQKMDAMGQLTGGVAHDFNNLLTPIVGALDALQRKGVGGEREQRLIAGAAQSADRAKTLVQRLLAFARRQPLQATAVDMAGLIKGMADLIASTSGPQIKVSMEVADNLHSAKADANQLEMALLNLAVNARDAMPNGGTLRISADEEPVLPGHRSGLPLGRFLRLSVADTGVGMDGATLARAVDPFFSTKGVGKGTGLGLSMVHGLALQLGGALQIQSRLGVGTNVELWLPLSDEPAQREQEHDDAAQALNPGAGTALLVDDEELVRASTADMLADLGYAVVEAGSAEEALAILRTGVRPQLLVTDHLMTGMNGTDLARIVRSEILGVQVLLVSGYAEAEGVAPDLPRLTKPFRRDELAASLASLAMPH